MTRIYHINLCDTVTVLFPALNVSTKAKVVKTVYDVLLDRYESITIGAVQAYLSAALAASQEKAVEKAVAISNSSANADYVTKTTFNALLVQLAMRNEISITSRTLRRQLPEWVVAMS